MQAKSRPGASEKGPHLVRVVDCSMSLRIVYLVTISQVWVALEDLMVFGVWAANWVGFQLRVYEKDECSNLVVLKDCRDDVKYSQSILSYQDPGDGIE